MLMLEPLLLPRLVPFILELIQPLDLKHQQRQQQVELIVIELMLQLEPELLLMLRLVPSIQELNLA